MEQPKLFRRKPTEILAIQWTGENEEAIKRFVGEDKFINRYDSARDYAEASLFVAANNSWINVQIGEWIAKDDYGFYPIQDVNGSPFNYMEANY